MIIRTNAGLLSNKDGCFETDIDFTFSYQYEYLCFYPHSGIIHYSETPV
jgi:hypothetical protein